MYDGTKKITGKRKAVILVWDQGTEDRVKLERLDGKSSGKGRKACQKREKKVGLIGGFENAELGLETCVFFEGDEGLGRECAMEESDGGKIMKGGGDIKRKRDTPAGKKTQQTIRVRGEGNSSSSG